MSAHPDWIDPDTAERLLRKRADMRIPDPPINPHTAMETAMWQTVAVDFELHRRADRLGAAAIQVCNALGTYIALSDHYGKEHADAVKTLERVRSAYMASGMEY